MAAPNKIREPFPTSMPPPSLPSQGNATTANLTSSLHIADNHMVSTANYIYSFLAALSLVSACFLLCSFIQTCRGPRRTAWLDCLFWVFCGSQLLLVFLSLSSAAYRPEYLKAAPLACAALSFSVNAASLCGLLLLVLMAYVLTFDPPSDSLLRRPGVSMALVASVSVLSSVVLAAVRWPSQRPVSHCIIDPVGAGPSYPFAKLCLSFLIPCSLLLGVLTTGRVRQWKSRGWRGSMSEELPVVLTLAVVTLLCQLFYDVVLFSAQMKADVEEHGLPLLSVAESVVFGGSAVSLLLVLFMHRSGRESLKGALRQLRDCSLGGVQTHRHNMAPHIEISDTLQDYN